MSRYSNSVLEPLFLNEYGPNDYSVNTIVSKNDELTFGGKFEIQPLMGIYGSNLATYNLVSDVIEPIAMLDHSVNTSSYFNNKLYVGGSFQMNFGTESVHSLGVVKSTVGIKESAAELSLNVYPNPFSTTINLENIENGASYSLLFIDGRIAKSGTVFNERIDGLDLLPKGTYLLQLETKKGSVVKTIVK